MRLNEHSLLSLFAMCGVSATLVLAAAPLPYDFTGHWSGTTTVPQHGQSVTYTINGDFTATGTNRFTGMLTVVGVETDCTVTGRRARTVKMDLACPDGTRPRLTGRLDTTTGTLTGAVSFVSRHGKPKHGTFTLSKRSG